jgi:hemolysin activation/secretion protein
VRGLDPRLSGDRAFAASLELEYAVLPRPAGSVLGSVRLAAFGDGVLGRGDLDPGSHALARAADAGLGVRVDHHVGRTTFQTRVDLPLWVSRPRLAQDHRPGGRFGLRWSLSFLPAF